MPPTLPPDLKKKPFNVLPFTREIMTSQNIDVHIVQKYIWRSNCIDNDYDAFQGIPGIIFVRFHCHYFPDCEHRERYYSLVRHIIYGLGCCSILYFFFFFLESLEDS